MTCKHEYTLELQSEKIVIEDALFIFNNDGRDVVGRMTEFNGSNNKRIYKTSYLGSKILNIIENISLPVCESVGTYAFQHCSKLTSANLPKCISVGYGAFYYCTALTSIDLPVCESIDGGAFEYCSALTSIDLPKCTTVGDFAFNSCSKLTSVILRSTNQAKLDSTNAFNNCSALTGIYVPDSLVSQYKAATNWSIYAAKIKPLSELPV